MCPEKYLFGFVVSSLLPSSFLSFLHSYFLFFFLSSFLSAEVSYKTKGDCDFLPQGICIFLHLSYMTYHVKVSKRSTTTALDREITRRGGEVWFAKDAVWVIMTPRSASILGSTHTHPSRNTYGTGVLASIPPAHPHPSRNTYGTDVLDGRNVSFLSRMPKICLITCEECSFIRVFTNRVCLLTKSRKNTRGLHRPCQIWCLGLRWRPVFLWHGSHRQKVLIMCEGEMYSVYKSWVCQCRFSLTLKPQFTALIGEKTYFVQSDRAHKEWQLSP